MFSSPAPLPRLVARTRRRGCRPRRPDRRRARVARRRGLVAGRRHDADDDRRGLPAHGADRRRRLAAGGRGQQVFVGGDFTERAARGRGGRASTRCRGRNLLAYDIDDRRPRRLVRAEPERPGPRGRRLARRLPASTSAATSRPIAGQTRYRIAAFDTATGALVTSFNPGLDSQVRAMVATNSTVYVGGAFTSANGGGPRQPARRVHASNGALLPWSPSADNGTVSALTVSPDGTMVIAGGSFTTLNGAAPRATASRGSTRPPVRRCRCRSTPSSATAARRRRSRA